MAGELDRPDLYVVARFLDRLHDAGGSYRKTELQLAVRLNYNVYKKYLAWLEARRYVGVRAGPEGERIHLTAEGRTAHARLVAWIKETLGDAHL